MVGSWSRVGVFSLRDVVIGSVVVGGTGCDGACLVLWQLCGLHGLGWSKGWLGGGCCGGNL